MDRAGEGRQRDLLGTGGDDAFYSSSGTLYALQVGGKPKRLATLEKLPRGLVATSRDVFWVDAPSGTVMRLTR